MLLRRPQANAYIFQNICSICGSFRLTQRQTRVRIDCGFYDDHVSIAMAHEALRRPKLCCNSLRELYLRETFLHRENAFVWVLLCLCVGN